MKKIFPIYLYFVIVFLAACQSIAPALTPTKAQVSSPTATLIPTPIPTPKPNVLFNSNVGAEYTGVTVSFEHPREWQTGYFSDSGAYGWLITDAEDPNEVFWSPSGNEIIILLIVGDSLEPNMSPSQLLEQFGVPSTNEGIIRITEKNVQAAYILEDGEFHGAAIVQQNAYLLGGEYPNIKEIALQNGLEIILRSLATHDAKNIVISSDLAWGIRNEGILVRGTSREGYVPPSSISMWTIDGKANQEIFVSIDSNKSESKIIFDINDTDGKSILPSGSVSFTGKLEGETVKLPVSGVYSIQIYPSTESQWYGSYQIEIK